MESALSGLRVLEIGHVVSAPFCGAMLADFGAEVIKVEAPGSGDLLRNMGNFKNMWFAVEDRNKKTITLDLKSEKGKELFFSLVKTSDVLIENFRPGALKKLGIDWEVVHKVNPRLIMVSVSGYGQTGPYYKKPGYDRLGMAMGGLTYLTGFPDGAPIRPGLAVSDYMTGLFALNGTLTALYYRDHGGNVGQHIDASLYESVLRIMEATLVDYSYKGVVRERIGNAHISTIPGGHYLTKDQQYIVLAVGGDKIFAQFVKSIGREELAKDERYATAKARSEHRAEIEAMTIKWIGEHTKEECLAAFGDDIPNGLIYTVEDIFNDPHIKARENIVTLDTDEFGTISMQGIVPKLSETPGKVKWAGPPMGAYNEEVYMGVLGLSEEEYKQYRSDGII